MLESYSNVLANLHKTTQRATSPCPIAQRAYLRLLLAYFLTSVNLILD